MAPWPRALVIPQLVDLAKFRDNQWVAVLVLEQLVKPLPRKMGIHENRRCHNSFPLKRSISLDCSGLSLVQFETFHTKGVVPINETDQDSNPRNTYNHK
ncbi:hypothetical protein TNCV_591701 [Trichonephila clavipes]|nr:hypothetical protein TNCV_591701 [Trichonephila clavipes]